MSSISFPPVAVIHPKLSIKYVGLVSLNVISHPLQRHTSSISIDGRILNNQLTSILELSLQRIRQTRNPNAVR
jgi:hypothetical protein